MHTYVLEIYTNKNLRIIEQRRESSYIFHLPTHAFSNPDIYFTPQWTFHHSPLIATQNFHITYKVYTNIHNCCCISVCLDKCVVICIQHCSTQNCLTVMKILWIIITFFPPLKHLGVTNLPNVSNFTFYRLFYSWNHTKGRFFRWATLI